MGWLQPATSACDPNAGTLKGAATAITDGNARAASNRVTTRDQKIIDT
jgi:hypothetical protein